MFDAVTQRASWPRSRSAPRRARWRSRRTGASGSPTSSATHQRDRSRHAAVSETVALPRLAAVRPASSRPAGAAYVALEGRGAAEARRDHAAHAGSVASGRTRAISRSAATARGSTSRASSRRRCRARPPPAWRTTPDGARGGEVRAWSTRPRWPCCARSCCATATSPTTENQGRGMPNYLGAAVISPDGTRGLGAVQAGQHQARHAARRPATWTSRTPCARSARASTWRPSAEDFARAHRPRQRQPRQRRRLRPARRLPVRRARDQPRGGGGRRARRQRAVPLRRRPRAAGPGASRPTA